MTCATLTRCSGWERMHHQRLVETEKQMSFGELAVIHPGAHESAALAEVRPHPEHHILNRYFK